MSDRKAIFVLGIDPTGTTIQAPAHVQEVATNPEKLRETVKAQFKKMSEGGYDVEVKQLKPDDFDSGLEWVKEKLASQHWDAFIVGGGIRQTPGFTVFFENVVNASREITPGTKLGFNTKPDDIYETCLRLC